MPSKNSSMICSAARADPDHVESLAIHMIGTNRLYLKVLEHVLYRKSLSTFPGHALAIGDRRRILSQAKRMNRPRSRSNESKGSQQNHVLCGRC